MNTNHNGQNINNMNILQRIICLFFATLLFIMGMNYAYDQAFASVVALIASSIGLFFGFSNLQGKIIEKIKNIFLFSILIVVSFVIYQGIYKHHKASLITSQTETVKSKIDLSYLKDMPDSDEDEEQIRAEDALWKEYMNRKTDEK